jgi:hypothetical protein
MSKLTINLQTGPHPIRWAPASATVPVLLGARRGVLREATTGACAPCQIEHVDGGARLTWLVEAAPIRAGLTYVLDTGGEDIPDAVALADDGAGKLDVAIGGRAFTTYNYGSQWARPFLYPVIGPHGTCIVRNWPMVEGIAGEVQDHPHHKGIWVAYGEVNGTDNWSEAEGHARVRHAGFAEATSGPVFGRFRAVNDWLSRDGVKQVEEVREFTFYATPAGERLADVTVLFRATVGDVNFTDTKEGGILGVRVASSMDGDKGGTIVNAYGGVTEAETWGKPSPWVDYCGPVEGRVVGIAIMNHPSSFRYPTRWHVRDYGLFTANPFALKHYEPERGWNGDHLLKQGEQLLFKYRLYIHDGRTHEANVRDKFLAFAYPPKITVEA